MKISIIIVNWNVKALLERCLASIEKYRGDHDIEIFVVDNNSNDGSWDYLVAYEANTEKNPEHILAGRFYFIANDKNVGFAKACNQAIKQAKGEYVYLLNPDSEITEDSFSGLLSTMDRRQKAGIVGSSIVYPDETIQQSVRRFPDWISPTLISLGMRIGPVRHYLAESFDYQHEQKVEQVMGASFFIRKKMIDDIGVLDERSFIWFEEVDYCLRAQEAGWEVWYTPNATIIHHGGKSFAQAFTCKKQRIYFQSLLKYFWKHHQLGSWFFNLLIMPLRVLIGCMMSTIQVGRRKKI